MSAPTYDTARVFYRELMKYLATPKRPPDAVVVSPSRWADMTAVATTPQEKLENEITGGDRWLRDAPKSPPVAPKAEKLESNPWAKQFPFGAGGKHDR